MSQTSVACRFVTRASSSATVLFYSWMVFWDVPGSVLRATSSIKKRHRDPSFIRLISVATETFHGLREVQITRQPIFVRHIYVSLVQGFVMSLNSSAGVTVVYMPVYGLSRIYTDRLISDVDLFGAARIQLLEMTADIHLFDCTSGKYLWHRHSRSSVSEWCLTNHVMAWYIESMVYLKRMKEQKG